MQNVATKPSFMNNAQKETKTHDTIQAAKKQPLIDSHILTSLIQLSLIFALIIWGWLNKPEEYLTAENGLGYALGIIGGSMMLLLLIYPLRKKIKHIPYLGSVASWFKFHMFCGIFGPIAILYHSNFSLGSLNSSIAMLCMITVAGSGIIGRYFYAKIHYGLYGSKASLNELADILNNEASHLASAYTLIPDIANDLKAYHQASLPKLDFLNSIKRFIILGFRVRLTALILPFKLHKAINLHANTVGWDKNQRRKNYRILKKHIQHFLTATLKTCEFSTYERLFGLWHVLHLPLFFMLIISGIVHVFAVHMY